MSRVLRAFLGPPRDPLDPATRRRTQLAALTAWAGLGAGGLSAACYGPEKAFLGLNQHAELGPALALLMIASVAVLALAYTQMLQLFPQGGGSYRIVSTLLGDAAGVLAGSALLVDYILTVAVCVTSGSDAMFSLFPAWSLSLKLPLELASVVLLVVMNLRGLNDAMRILLPVALGFLLTHGLLIMGGLTMKAPHAASTVGASFAGVMRLAEVSSWAAVAGLLVHAYGLGGSTYSGLEAVSNNVNLLDEPRLRTGRLAMTYVGWSLALTAGGLVLIYSLWGVSPRSGVTLNAAVFAQILDVTGLPAVARQGVMFLSMALEAALLFVAANSILIFAPALLANMASDAWLPRQFRNLSVRLVRQNGVVFVGVCAAAILLLTGGKLGTLLTFYSINVFIGVALAKAALIKHWWGIRGHRRAWVVSALVSLFGFCAAAGILVVTLKDRFFDGGWATICLTALVVGGCLAVRRHYEWIGTKRTELDEQFALSAQALVDIPEVPNFLDRGTAVILATDRPGQAIHALLWIQRLFPDQFANVLFVRVIEVDVATMGKIDQWNKIKADADASMAQMVGFCAYAGLHAEGVIAHATDPVQELERLLSQAVQERADAVCFANKLILPPRQRLAEWLHNGTALHLQRRLHELGIPLVILPIKLGG